MVALFAIGEGMNVRMEEQLRALGGAEIMIYSQSGTRGMRVAARGNPISEEYVATVQAIPGVETATGILTGSGEARKNQTYIIGIDPESYFQLMGELNIIEGRTLLPSDLHNYGTVIGLNLAEELNVTIGSNLNTKSWGGAWDAPWISFEIVGICETGNPQQDRGMFIHLSHAQYILTSEDEYGAGERHVTQILVKTEDPSKIDDVVKRIEEAVPDVRVFAAKTMIQRIQESMSTMILFLEGIGSIALIAGTIGILNTMMMSVFERTREIGTLKAIGAKDREILIIILTEAAIIGILAGAIGCVTGAAGTLVWEYFSRTEYGITSIQPVITLEILLTMFGIGIVTGVLAGLYPAWRASRMDPVEALRHG
jgi:putative ABC transport system permease protein